MWNLRTEYILLTGYCSLQFSPTQDSIDCQRPHESFSPGSTSKQKSIKQYKNLIVYELFKFLS